MFGKKTEIKVFRATPAIDNLSDPVYNEIATYYGSVQPFTADQASHNAQQFENVRDYISFIGNPEIDIQFGDELAYNGEYRRVQYIERFRQVLPHAELYVADSQWSRT